MEEAQRAHTFADLPGALLVLVFLLVPVDTRMRFAEVCRKWRATLLAETRLWTTLDVSRAARLDKRPTEAMLSAAVRRADGQLVRLDIDDVDVDQLGISALLRALTPSAASLRELHIRVKDYCFEEFNVSGEKVRELVGALPSLTRVVCGVSADATEALPLLRAEPPFGALALRGLHLKAARSMTLETWHAVCSATVVCPSMEALHLSLARLNPPEAAVVVDAALSRRLKRVRLTACPLSVESMSAFARLLREGVLEVLAFRSPITLPLGELAPALRASTTLQSLTLFRVGLWRDVHAGAALLEALIAHPTLRNLDLTFNVLANEADGHVAGAALAALVEANSPALMSLNLSTSGFRDATLAPLLAALHVNTRLRELNILVNEPSHAFTRDVLEPAKRAARARAQPLQIISY